MHFISDLSLGAEYQRCALRAQKRNQGRQRAGLEVLSLPSDGRPVAFSREARKGIPTAVRDEIRCVNGVCCVCCVL